MLLGSAYSTLLACYWSYDKQYLIWLQVVTDFALNTDIQYCGVLCKDLISGVLSTRSGACAARVDASHLSTLILNIYCSTHDWTLYTSINTRSGHLAHQWINEWLSESIDQSLSTDHRYRLCILFSKLMLLFNLPAHIQDRHTRHLTL